jgi:cytochrome c oxidase cbb3-type subunit 2
MTRVYILLMGALATVIFALMVLVILPKSMLSGVQPPAELKPLTAKEKRGRQVYIENGCIYCHTQQVRDTNFTQDVAKGMGNRPSVPADYVYDQPHLLGTMRTGPDLFNVGSRLPDKKWHLLHLYQPRSLVPWSIMPAFPFLFEHKDTPAPDDVVIETGRAEAGAIVATEDAKALVAYLLALKHDYAMPNIQKEAADE